MNFEFIAMLWAGIMTLVWFATALLFYEMHKKVKLLHFQIRSLAVLLLKPTNPGCRHKEVTTFGKFSWCVFCGIKVPDV